MLSQVYSVVVTYDFCHCVSLYIYCFFDTPSVFLTSDFIASWQHAASNRCAIYLPQPTLFYIPLLLCGRTLRRNEYRGEFVVPDMDMTIKIYISKDKLMVSATGHPNSELYSTKINEFKIKNMKDFLLKFLMSEDKPLAVEVISLTGQFKALAKKI